jgi:magnesium-transporting ATPase (P-type)
MRASIQNKIKIIKNLQAKGQFVAMTGDGISMMLRKIANIGIAMNQRNRGFQRSSRHDIIRR